jgi:hypothetical protein
MLTVIQGIPIMSVDLGIIANRHCHIMDVDQILSTIKKIVPIWRTL